MMKMNEVQNLTIGTKLYLMDFDIEATLGRVSAQIVECEVRPDVYSDGKHIARRYEYRGKESWATVRPRWCYMRRDQAERELTNRIKMVQEKLAVLAS